MDFVPKIKSGFGAFSTAWAFARMHNVLIFFAAAKAIVLIIGVGLFVVLERFEIIALSEKAQQYAKPQLVGMTLMVVIPLVILGKYWARLMDVCAMHYTLGALENRRVTVVESFKKSIAALWLLFKFVLLDYLLTILTKRDESSSRFAFINNILSSLVGLAWRVATFFIIPVVAEERLSLRASIARSAEIMKNSFGQTTGFQLGILVYLFLPICLMLALGAGLLWSAQYIDISVNGIIFGFIVWLCLMLLVASVCYFIYTLTTWVFIAAAYNYTRGRDTGPFDAHFITAAFVKK
jgi:hypothetical protein